MSLTNCCAPCPTVETVNVPGIEGADGAAGSSGSNGVGAFTVVTGAFNVPPDLVTPVTIGVANSSWMVIGQILIIGQGAGVALANPGPATFIVNAIPSGASVQLLWLNYPGDVAAGTAISANAIVSPSGKQPAAPLSIANGGTGGTSKTTAQTALGLGQDAIVSAGDALAQDFTNAFVQVGAVGVAIPAAGEYLVGGSVSIEAAGLTFAANQTLLVRIRDVTNGATVAQITRHTDTPTTIHIPSFDWYLPDSLLAAVGALNLQLQVQNLTGAAPGAGTLRAVGGSLSATPLRKS
jgi:hypothetical protein